MRQCSGIKADGSRCTQSVEPPETYCWHHTPKRAEERRRAASRGGRSRPSTEVRTIKEEIKTVITDVKTGDLDRNDAAVMIQGYRALKDFIALERGIRVEDELAAELEEIRRERGHAS
jgi:hypothetical protein